MRLFLSKDATPVEKRAAMYLTCSYMGAVSIVMGILARLLDWPDFVQGLSLGLLLVALLLLLLRKFRDEYYERLWAAGTSLAFATLVVWYLFAPFADGILNGFTQAPQHQEVAYSWGPAIAILAFFVGFHTERWRSR